MDPSAMNMDGSNGLACLTKIEEEAKETTITPLFAIKKDLVVDMTNFDNQNIEPRLSEADVAPGKEILQRNVAGVCIMSNAWKDEQDPSLISFISAFLSSNSFRLNFVSISPDLIFNCGGVSIAFVFVTKWDDCCNVGSFFNRVKKLKTQFARLYVVATLSTKEQNDSFMRSYFHYEMEFGRPAFVPVTDAEMGFEKIVKIAHSRGVCKQQKVASKLKVERKRTVQDTDTFIRVLTSIPNINKHDANSLYLTIGSIEATAKTSKEDIFANTDLSSDKAEMLTKFFQDPEFYLSPKFN